MWIRQATAWSNSSLIRQSVSQPASQPTDQSAYQTNNQPANHIIASQSDSQSSRQLASQTASQTASQSASQSASQQASQPAGTMLKGHRCRLLVFASSIRSTVKPARCIACQRPPALQRLTPVCANAKHSVNVLSTWCQWVLVIYIVPV